MMMSPLFFLVPVLLSAQIGAISTERRVLAMGTELCVHLDSPDAGSGAEAALVECTRIEAACSTWRAESAWSRLNSAQGRAMPLDREWITLLGEARAWSGRTQGAFDPVLMALLQAWGVRTGGRTPSEAEWQTAREACGAQLLELDPKAGTARLTAAGAGIEEGAFLKGYALDAMRKVSGAPSGWIDFGGQLLAWGEPRPVAITDPLDRQMPRLILTLRNASVSSSGTSERGRHILDPRSGRPCAAWGATAVVASDAFTADVLSTALYVLGPEEGLAWADHHQVAAVFLLNNGSLRMSEAFHAMNPTDIPKESR